jgi:hypothetical protein
MGILNATCGPRASDRRSDAPGPPGWCDGGMAHSYSRPPRHRTYPRVAAKPADLTARREVERPWSRAVPAHRSFPRAQSASVRAA